MSYVISKDYKRVINPSELAEILQVLRDGQSVADSKRLLVEGTVEQEMNASLSQEFDLGAEFSSLDKFIVASIFKGNNRVYLDATAYDAVAGVYASNDLTLQVGSVYRNITPISVPEVFNVSKWTLLGAQYDLFYVNLPFPLFDQNTFYFKGDIVFWKDRVYTAQKDSIPVDQQDALQAPSIESIRYGNVTPDDRFVGAKMWGAGTSFSFSGLFVDNPAQTAWSSVTSYTVGLKVSFGGINYVASGASTNIQPGTDITKWIPILWVSGDNRNQMFVEMFLDMVVYKLTKSITPDNVPEARHNAFLLAEQNLKAFADGNKNAHLPKIQPLQGNRIRFGGNPKQQNAW